VLAYDEIVSIEPFLLQGKAKSTQREEMQAVIWFGTPNGTLEQSPTLDVLELTGKGSKPLRHDRRRG
jgi:hypothetical protein